MSNYTAFAEFYDQLTDNVDYKKRAEYFCKLWSVMVIPWDSLWIWLAEQAA